MLVFKKSRAIAFFPFQKKSEIQRKACEKKKSTAFIDDTCLEKERVRSKVTPKKGNWDCCDFKGEKRKYCLI